MKNKLLSAVVAVIICLISALPAFASLSYNPFEVEVTAESVAVLYDQVWNSDMTQSIMRPTSIFAPNGAKLTSSGELIFENEVYLYVEYSDIGAYVKSSDVQIVKSKVGEEAAYDTEGERSVVIINKDGVYLRKGPSFAYDAASDVIPYGTTVTYDKIDYNSELYTSWAYTEYNGKSGWLYIGQYNAIDVYDTAYILSENDYYTGVVETLTDGAYLTETPDSDSAKVAENIPAGTRLSYKYLYENYESISVYAEYDGAEGWLRTRSDSYKVATGEKGGIYVLAEDGLPLCSSPLDGEADAVATLPKGTNLSVDLHYWDSAETDGTTYENHWMHVNYNGSEGWVFSNDSSEYCYMYSAYDYKIIAEDGVKLYPDLSGESEAVSVIPKDTVVTAAYKWENEAEVWVFVEYDGVQGWISVDNSNSEYVENSGKQLDAPHGAQAAESENTDTAPEIIQETVTAAAADNADEGGISTKTLIIIGVSAAVLVVVLVAIILIKRKNKIR